MPPKRFSRDVKRLQRSSTVPEAIGTVKNVPAPSATLTSLRDPSVLTASITPARDPSVPITVPTTSKEPKPPDSAGLLVFDPPEKPQQEKSKWWTSIYDKKKKAYCGRTCLSWLLIILYSIMYLIFLSTYTMIFLYGSLSIIKNNEDYQLIEKVELLTYSEKGIGLSATPTSEHSNPLIWYEHGNYDAYEKYINSLDTFLAKRQKRDVQNFSDTTNESELGPCGSPPYGYGDKPCVVIRINKQRGWSAKPLPADSSLAKNAPAEVKKWMKSNHQKLWLHCSGIHSYDKEHIGKIKYYPDPPGFNPNDFPIDLAGKTPLVAVQISELTLGVSLTIECKLWYELGTSSIGFMIYVTPQKNNFTLRNFSK